MNDTMRNKRMDTYNLKYLVEYKLCIQNTETREYKQALVTRLGAGIKYALDIPGPLHSIQ